jgi:geranylgeranyl diphosphate synthase type II
MATPESNLADSLVRAHSFIDANFEDDLQAEAGTPAKVDPSVHDIFRYTLMSPSAKRLRPDLVLMTAEALGSSWDEVVELAKGVEEFHTVSLIFDDMPDQDNSPTRRGQPAAHVVFGERRARMGAMEMLNQAYRSVIEADVRHDLRGELSIYATELISKLLKGQNQDLDTFQSEARAATTVEKLDKIAHRKTGVLIEMGIVGAGLIAGVSPQARTHLEDYAREFGQALQVHNDLSDLTQRGDDSRNGRPTYVSVMGGIEPVRAKLLHHSEQAIAAIEPLKPDIDITRFEQVVGFIGSQAALRA